VEQLNSLSRDLMLERCPDISTAVPSGGTLER
jgi:hypothetical protein